MDRLTSKFQEALSDAQSLAVGRDHQFIEPVHLMIALLDQQGGSIRPLFSHAGVNINLLRSQLGELLDKQPRVEGAAGDLHISNALGKLLNVTDKLAQERKDQFISSELFVLAAMDEKGPLSDVLKSAGADKQAIAAAVDNIRQRQRRRPAHGARKIHHRPD
jgi:ATP-dependent Clp protease ATP-binding subunit ClpB